MGSLADEPSGAGLAERRLTVLHVSQPGSEGVANFVRDLSAEQSARGLGVAVAGPPDSPLAAAAEKLDVGWWPWSARRWPGPSVARERRDLAAVIAEVRPDIVHLHSTKAGIVGRLEIRGRLPTVFQPHAWSFEATGGLVSRSTVGWERLAGRWAHAIVTVSHGEQTRATELGIRAAAVESTIPNPVDTEYFRPATVLDTEAGWLRRSVGMPTEPLVACLGRLCRQKGQDVLLRAWPRVLAEVPNAQLLLIGDGPSRSEFEAAAGENVQFLGSRSDVAEILREVQLVVLPSRWEGMSLAMLEAMASAKSVVATDVGGVAETVGQGAGAVVPVGDIDRLAAEITTRILHPELAEREGAVGRSIAVERHTLTSTLDSLDEVYRTVLSKAGSRTGSQEGRKTVASGPRPAFAPPVRRADG